MIKYIVFRSQQNRQWYFHIKSRNGKVIAQSEGYRRRSSAVKTVNRIKTAGAAKLIFKP